MNDIIHSVLRRLDILERPVFTFDELNRWPDGTIPQLEAYKLLRGVEHQNTVRCDSCDENEILYPPQIIHDAQRGRPMAVAWCPLCGRIVYEVDRLRMWEVDFEFLATIIQKQFDIDGAISPVIDRTCYYLGSLKLSNAFADIFLLRRAQLQETVILADQCERLRRAVNPVIIFPNMMSDASWSRDWGKPMMISLSELAPQFNGSLQFNQERFLARIEQSLVIKPLVELGEAEAVLTVTEINILQALAESHPTPMLLVEIADKAGYSKGTVRDGLKRIRALEFIAKPKGTARKGEIVTSKGLAYLRQFSEKNVRSVAKV